MKNLSLFLLLTILLSGCGGSSANIVSVEFGNLSGVGDVKFTPQTRFSRHQENHYGWLVAANPEGSTVEVREEIEAPVATSWGDPSSDVQIEDGGKKAITTLNMPVGKGGFILSNWSTAPSDPAGIYKAKLIIEGKLVKEVSFTVE